MNTKMLWPLVVVLLTAASPSTVSWQDDFLGARLDGRYAVSTAGSGAVQLVTFAGGAVELRAQHAGGVARMRFGEEPGSSHLDVRHWTVEKHVRLQARVSLSTTKDVQATIGFVGVDDPRRSLAALYNSKSRNPWVLSATSDESGTQRQASAAVDFEHQPGEMFEFDLVATPTAAHLSINGKKVATLVPPSLPLTEMTPEFQLWNHPSRPDRPVTMLVDWFAVEQQR